VRPFPEALAGDPVLCSWARHLTLTVPLSTQEYKWVLANCWGNLKNFGGMTCDGLASRPGSKTTPSRSMVRKPEISYGSYDPVGSKASFILRKRESKNVHLLVFKEFMNSSGIQFLEQNNYHFFH